MEEVIHVGLPLFPELPEAPDQQELLNQLLHTVALEQLALAALINAEAEKVQQLAAAGVMGPVDAEVLARVNEAVAEVVKQAAAKEDRLQRKLMTILAAKDAIVPTPTPPPNNKPR